MHPPLEHQIRTLHERVIGPVEGLYLACYAVRSLDGTVAYAKVCRSAPASLWDTRDAVRKLAAGPYQLDEAQAVDALAEAVTRLLQERARRRGPTEWLRRWLA